MPATNQIDIIYATTQTATTLTKYATQRRVSILSALLLNAAA